MSRLIFLMPIFIFLFGDATAAGRNYYICKDPSGNVGVNDRGCGKGSVCKDSKGNWSAEECARIDAINANVAQEALKPPPPRWEPRIGMTDEEVRRKTESRSSDVPLKWWGGPHSINTTKTARGTKEQWVFGQGWYLYFDNGVLTAIQE